MYYNWTSCERKQTHLEDTDTDLRKLHNLSLIQISGSGNSIENTEICSSFSYCSFILHPSVYPDGRRLKLVKFGIFILLEKVAK